jgi:transcriptional regulator with PAS, ATPase and Fis domain
MKSDLHDLKKLTLELMQNGVANAKETNANLIKKIYGSNEDDNEIYFEEEPTTAVMTTPTEKNNFQIPEVNYQFTESIEEEEVLKLEQKEIELIKKSLEKNKGKRKLAADELGISERTLYRKIKQFDL